MLYLQTCQFKHVPGHSYLHKIMNQVTIFIKCRNSLIIIEKCLNLQNTSSAYLKLKKQLGRLKMSNFNVQTGGLS
jgi:hypothetical protein